MKTLLVLLLIVILILVIAILVFGVVDLWLDEWDSIKDRWEKRRKEVDDEHTN